MDSFSHIGMPSELFGALLTLPRSVMHKDCPPEKGAERTDLLVGAAIDTRFADVNCSQSLRAGPEERHVSTHFVATGDPRRPRTQHALQYDAGRYHLGRVPQDSTGCGAKVGLCAIQVDLCSFSLSALARRAVS